MNNFKNALSKQVEVLKAAVVDHADQGQASVAKRTANSLFAAAKGGKFARKQMMAQNAENIRHVSMGSDAAAYFDNLSNRPGSRAA